LITLQTFFEFSLVAILLALAPGPDILFVLTQSITKGAKAGIALAVGLCSGVTVHTFAATLGASVIFKTSEVAFTILKVAGALYLFYLAYQAFIHRNESLSVDKNSKQASFGVKKLIIRGFFMNVLNPKVALFFLALFPQFVNENAGGVAFQMIHLGAIVMACAFSVFLCVSIFANKASRKLMQNKKISKIANVLTSIIFVAIGIKLAFSQR
jgi:threonine/homoserine/homoserine lactone efflux protein